VLRVRAFTLFEIAVSLAVLAMTVAVVAAVFPIGLKAQTAARFQLYASAKALEVVDTYNSANNLQVSVDPESPVPWDVPLAYCSLAPDLEQRVSSYRTGIFPVPLTIARRLDSDNDEIQQVLDERRHLYYSQPRATTGIRDSALPEAPPNEAQKLVFAVVGHPQQNALPYFPWKAWPYYAAYPSPPMHGWHINEPGYSLPATPTRVHVATLSSGGSSPVLWEDTVDADIARVIVLDPATTPRAGYVDYAAATGADVGPAAIRYCQAAAWYCAKKGLPLSLYDGSAVATDFDGGLEPWKQVQGLRFLAHAATCLTACYSKATLDASATAVIPSITCDGITSHVLALDHQRIVNLHDSCMNLAMRFAASFPYDWRAPRPLNRSIMMDHPLIQWDLWSPRLAGKISSTSATAEQWRPILAQDAVGDDAGGLGTSFHWMTHPIPTIDPAFAWWRTASSESLFGDRANFTLTKPFAACERARQLVFWSVDWTSYEDFETAPSAPVDASKYPIATPRNPLNGATFAGRMANLMFMDWRMFSFRNPEKTLCFIASVAGLPTGADVLALRNGNQDFMNVDPGRSDQGDSLAARRVFSGLFGADRNGNGALDRGPISPSVRLRAMLVGRYNFYDMRVPATIR